MLILGALWLVVVVPLALVLLAVVIAGAGKVVRRAGRGKRREK